MSTEDLTEENINFARSSINDLLGLRLSDDEIGVLMSGEALSVEKLLENRSLSEVGTALIQADTIDPMSQKCYRDLFGKVICVGVRIQRQGLELDLHQPES